MVKRIIDVFEKYDTDKNSKGHNYTPYYAEHLPESANKILEIGVHKSESIRAWHEIYPEAHIFGLDLFSEHEPIKEDWFTAFSGNQADSKLLDTVRLFGPFDFILEDGSHSSRHQLMSFYGLVGSFTKMYIVEDLQCCEEDFYRQGMDYADTFLNILEDGGTNMIENGWVGKFREYKTYLYNSKIAFICRQNNQQQSF